MSVTLHLPTRPPILDISILFEIFIIFQSAKSEDES